MVINNRRTTQAIVKMVKKSEETGVVTNTEMPALHRFTRFAENIAIVSENVVEDPNRSIPLRSHKFGLSYGTLWRTLYLDLNLKSSSRNN